MTTTPIIHRGIVLFAHGSRDPLWHKPIEAVAAHIATLSPHTPVVCAYLELSTPDLETATGTLVQQGVQAITILPMFLGVGKHAREDLPQRGFSGYTLDNRLISGSHGITNNRVWALYAGVSGVVSRGWGYEVRASFSRNYGSFSVPFPRRAEQLSTSASLNKPMRWLGGSTLLVSVGYDQGQLLRSPSQVGTYVGLRKVWRSPAANRQ